MITNYLKQIRLVHWIKNILIFFPIIITSEINKIDYKIIYAFLSFSFLCSFFYCLNDLNDFNIYDKELRDYYEVSTPIDKKNMADAARCFLMKWNIEVVIIKWYLFMSLPSKTI